MIIARTSPSPPPPPPPVVDLVTGKCERGIVSRPVFTSPLTLDLTVVCTSGVKVPPPGASAQVVLPPATVAGTMTAIGTSYAVRCNSGSSGRAAGDVGQGVSDTSVVGVAKVTSVVRTVVLISIAHAAVGSSGGLVATLFAQLCSGGMISGCSGRGQFVQCVTAFTGTLLSASTKEHVVSGWRGPIADDDR